MELQKDISSVNSAIGQTLTPYYESKRKDDTIALFFNDDHRHFNKKKASDAEAHSKGVVIANEDGGFFLQHSVPNFPPYEGTYDYTGSYRNGQHLFCVSIKEADAEALAEIFFYTRPSYYHRHIPSKYNSWTFLNQIRNGLFSNEDMNGMEEVVFNSTLETNVFYKTFVNETQLWHEVTDHYSRINFTVSTWVNGQNSNYNWEKIHPIKVITRITMKNYYETSWPITKHHSKIGFSEDTHIVCLSDLNYVSTQEHRGGAIFCIRHPGLWKAIQHEFNYEVTEDAEVIFAMFRDSSYPSCKKHYDMIVKMTQ